MSEQTQSLNTGNMAIIKTDVSKIFLWDNRYIEATYTNSDLYDPVTLPAGTLMGRIHATGKVVPLASGASDGSATPLGVLAADYTVEEGDDQVVSICVAGDVAEEKVLLQGSDTLDTVISNRRLRDRIGAETVGIKLVPGTEQTAYDNE